MSVVNALRSSIAALASSCAAIFEHPVLCTLTIPPAHSARTTGTRALSLPPSWLTRHNYSCRKSRILRQSFAGDYGVLDKQRLCKRLTCPSNRITKKLRFAFIKNFKSLETLTTDIENNQLAAVACLASWSLRRRMNSIRKAAKTPRTPALKPARMTMIERRGFDLTSGGRARSITSN